MITLSNLVDTDHIAALALDLGLSSAEISIMSRSEVKAAQTFRPGVKAMYSTMQNGVVLVVVTKGAHYIPMHGWYVTVKVTSRRNGSYKAGELIPMPLTNPWFSTRFGRYAR